MAGALDGVKILGFTHFAQGPFALQLLGDMGADVINIERPGKGDFNRVFNSCEALGGESPFFLAMNRNKRSVSLNTKAPEAKEIVTRLIRWADVVVTNFRAGALDKLGFGYEEAKKIKESIVYCEALGYGSSGPYSHLAGQDLLAQSLTGYATVVGPDQDDRPVAGGIYVVDMYSSMMLTVGLLAALYHAKQTGEGQKVEINLLDSGIHMQSQELAYFLNTGNKVERPKTYSGHPLQEAPYGIYQTRNGWMCLATNASDHVEDFARLIEVPDLPSLMPDKKTMMRDRDKIHTVIEEALKKRDTEYWISEIQALDIWCAKVNRYEEIENDPQVKHNKIIQTIEHPVAGSFKAIGAPIHFSKTPVSVRRTSPALGEHNLDVLKELGFDDKEIRSLQDSNIF